MERPEAGWLAPRYADPLLRWIPPRWRQGPRTWIVVGAVVWLPLLGLCLLAETALGVGVDRPFLGEFSVHARYLFALPMLLLADSIIRARQEAVLQYFFDSEILSDEDQEILPGRIARIVEMRDAPAAQFILIFIAFVASALIAREGLGNEFSSWSDGGPVLFLGLSPAGWWRTAISNPVWIYLLLRWAWCLILWSRLLAAISRMDLRLVPTHPDRVGGLGMLEAGQLSNIFLVIAMSVALAGDAANSIQFEALALPSLTPTLVIYVLVCLIVAIGPLLRFTSRLRQARREGLAKYGDLGYELFRSFEDKWVPIDARDQRRLLGDVDPSSLADFGYAFEVVGQMRLIPFSRWGVVLLVIAALAPFAPLVLFKYSMLEIVQRLLGILG